MIDKSIFDNLKKLQEDSLGNMFKEFDKLPDEHKAFFKPFIDAVKSGEQINISEFIEKTNNYASRFNNK